MKTPLYRGEIAVSFLNKRCAYCVEFDRDYKILTMVKE